jgi:hypothetical protein
MMHVPSKPQMVFCAVIGAGAPALPADAAPCDDGASGYVEVGFHAGPIWGFGTNGDGTRYVEVSAAAWLRAALGVGWRSCDDNGERSTSLHLGPVADLGNLGDARGLIGGELTIDGIKRDGDWRLGARVAVEHAPGSGENVTLIGVRAQNDWFEGSVDVLGGAGSVDHAGVIFGAGGHVDGRRGTYAAVGAVALSALIGGLVLAAAMGG